MSTIKSKYLAIFRNKCRMEDSLGIDYSWCGNGRGGQPNLELQFDSVTGDLVGAVFMPEGTRWDDQNNNQGDDMTDEQDELAHDLMQKIDEEIHAILNKMTDGIDVEVDEVVRERLAEGFRFYRR